MGGGAAEVGHRRTPTPHRLAEQPGRRYRASRGRSVGGPGSGERGAARHRRRPALRRRARAPRRGGPRAGRRPLRRARRPRRGGRRVQPLDLGRAHRRGDRRHRAAPPHARRSSAPRCSTRRRSAARTSAPTRASRGGGRPPTRTSTPSSPCRSCSAATSWPRSTSPTRTAASRADDERLVRRPGRPRRGAHRARPPLRGQPGAVGARGAQPPRARAARRAHAVALRAPAPARGRRRHRRAASVLEEVFAELRSLILQLRPPALELEGLVPSLAKHLDVVGRTHGLADRPRRRRPSAPLEPDVEQALFRIAQEAVTNAVRHAGGHRVVRAPRTATTSCVTLAVERRRAGLRPARPRGQRPTARPRVDARAGRRSSAGRSRIESRAGRGHDRPRRGAGGGTVTDADADPRRWSSTTTPSCARACARSSGRATGMEVVGEAGDVDEAVAAAADARARRRAARPRAARAAAGSPPSPACSPSTPRPHVLVLTSFGGDEQALAAVRAGASGWLGKDVPPAELEAAIRTVHRGGSVLDPAIAARVLAEVSSPGRRRPGPRPAHGPRAGGAGPARPRACRTGSSPPASSWPRRRSRPTCRRSSPSSSSPTARRPRCSPCTTGWSRPRGPRTSRPRHEGDRGPMAAAPAVRTVGA